MMLKPSIILVSARGVGMALAFVFNLLIARQLPQVDYGLAISSYTLILLASMIARNGNHIWIPRDMARMTDHGQKMSVAVRGVAQAVLYASAIATLLIAYLALIQSNASTVSYNTKIATGGIIVAHAICETLTSVFVGLKRPMTAGMTSFILPNLLLVSTVMIFNIGSVSEYLALLLFSYGVVSIAILVVGYTVSRPKFDKTNSNVFSVAPILAHLPVTSVDLFIYLNANIDILVLSSIGTAEDLALFGFVQKLGSSLTMLYFLPRMISGPVFSQLFYAGDIDGVKKEFRRVTGLMCILGIIVATVILVTFPYVADFVGKYREHEGVLFLVLLGALMSVLFGPLLLLLNMTENNHSLGKYAAGFLLMKLTLLIAAYQLLNLFWYAATGTLALVLWNILLYYLAKARIG